MTDIWRSFVAQRIALTCNWPVFFNEVTVYQERNAHNLIKDFADETSGYIHNSKIAETLSSLQLENETENIGINLIKCYEALISIDVVGKEELPIEKAWVNDMT